MASVLDLEAAKISKAAEANISAGDPPATLSEEEKREASQFTQNLNQSIADFKASKEHAEERLGILLLLKYKYALDEMSLEYWKARTAQSSVACPVTCETYVKARELYQAHLESHPLEYPTKEAYEEFLTEQAAALEAHTRHIGKRDLLYKMKVFRVVDSLNLTGSRNTNWGDHPGWNGAEEHNKLRASADAFYHRSQYALIGGFALVVPMLIMKLFPSTLNVCLTTTLFVIAAALLMATFMENTEPKDILGMTAAYAAVLVVFVGTTTTSLGGNSKKVAIVMGAIVGVLALVMSIYSVFLKFRVRFPGRNR